MARTAPDDDEPLVPRIVPNLAGNRQVAPASVAPAPGCHPPGVEDPAAVGLPRLGPLSPRRTAQTLEEAVAMHGGQGAAAAHRFFALTPRERPQVEAFLKSLVAPSAVRLARNGD